MPGKFHLFNNYVENILNVNNKIEATIVKMKMCLKPQKLQLIKFI